LYGGVNEKMIYVPRQITFRYKCSECLHEVVRYYYSAYDDDFDKFVNAKVDDLVTVDCPNCKNSQEIRIQKMSDKKDDY
jgi:transcription elongation factor Elf1